MASSVSLTNNSSQTNGIGSGPRGQSMPRLLCASVTINGPTTPGAQCNKPGTLACSKCHLASYCSKECQTLHWKKHRVHCKSPYLDKAWQPAWITQNREPAFMTGSDGAPYISFGPPVAYLWGNVPAIDCLNIVRNEGQSAVNQNFKFCFAASGDIRNLIRTVNGLPDQYRGNCHILFNDLNPLVVGHNLVVLCALLSPEYPVEDAAELALNLMYSTALTPSMSSSLSQIMLKLSNTPPSQTVSVPTSGKGTIQTTILPRNLEPTFAILRSSYDLRAAREGYYNIMLSPQRKDYRDRYMSGLKPSHRLGFSMFRELGILAPFSLNTSDFTEPNRLLFSPKGHWLLRDSETPLDGWDVAAVQKSGHTHGVDAADVYGSLFFHVKDEFIKFATRVRNFKIGITLTQFDALNLPGFIAEGMLQPFHTSCFDRIETSNLADYATIPSILNDWSPILNRQNKHATLMMSLMNWRQKEGLFEHGMKMDKGTTQKYASIMGIDMFQAASSHGGKYSPSLFRFRKGLGVFIDDSKKFQTYLRNTDTQQVATSHGMRMRTKHYIHPKRYGYSLLKSSEPTPNINAEEYYDMFTLGSSQSTTRFIEFEACI